MYCDYFYGEQSEQFQFYRIPRQLIKGEEFRCLSADAKLLYGLMLDRMGLSVRNGWYDEQGRVYIYFTLEEVQKILNCGHNKAVRLLAALDTVKGIGLIERVKQGQGKPCRIYVKQFIAAAPPEPEKAPSESGSQEVGETEVKTSEKPMSRVPKIRSLDFPKGESNYTDKNQTEKNHTDPSIYQSYLSRSPPRSEVCTCCTQPLVRSPAASRMMLDQQVWHFDGKCPC